MRDGRGTMVWTDGTKFTGEWSFGRAINKG